MGGNQNWRETPTQVSDGDADGAQSDSANMSACIWDDMRSGANPPLNREISQELQAGANQFAAELAQASSDGQARELFDSFTCQYKGYNSFEMALAVNEAMQKQGVDWHVAGNNRGDISLFRNQPEREERVLLQSQFFKPGEDIDADFNPNEGEVSRFASGFAQSNPDRLAPNELATEINRVLANMKAAGAGPKDAKNALNDALDAGNQNLKVYINTDGEVEVEEHFRNRAVAQRDLTPS
jgi:hypothetical protein